MTSLSVETSAFSAEVSTSPVSGRSGGHRSFTLARSITIRVFGFTSL